MSPLESPWVWILAALATAAAFLFGRSRRPPAPADPAPAQREAEEKAARAAAAAQAETERKIEAAERAHDESVAKNRDELEGSVEDLLEDEKALNDRLLKEGRAVRGDPH